MAIKPLSRQHLHDLEFIIRPYLRPYLFAGSEEISEESISRAKGSLIGLLLEFRAQLGDEFRVTSEELCKEIKYRGDARANVSRLKKGEGSLVIRAIQIVAVLLLGCDGMALIGHDRTAHQSARSATARRFRPRDWSTETESSIARRILELLFVDARKVGQGESNDRSAAERQGFFHTRARHPRNSYDALANLRALGWVATHSEFGGEARIVRVSGGVPFLETRRAERGGWLLTRSGCETISLLSTGRVEVIYVLPCESEGPEVESFRSFKTAAEQILSPVAAARLQLRTLDPVARKAGSAASSSFLSPCWRYVWYQEINPSEPLNPWPDLKIGEEPNVIPVGERARSAVETLYLQRELAHKFGPAAFDATENERAIFAAWLSDYVIDVPVHQGG